VFVKISFVIYAGISGAIRIIKIAQEKKVSRLHSIMDKTLILFQA